MLIEINCLSINLSVAKFDWFIHMIVPFHQFKLEDSLKVSFLQKSFLPVVQLAMCQFRFVCLSVYLLYDVISCF